MVNKRHGEIELVRVASFARRKLSEQIQPAFKTSTCLGMNGLRDTAQPGAVPTTRLPRGWAGTGITVAWSFAWSLLVYFFDTL
jgi:hypothetical protein